MNTTIIAEVGSNWHSLDDCLKSVEAIRNLGCVPKFQAYRADKLCSKQRDPVQYETLKLYELPDEWIKRLGAEGAFFSVFDCDMIDFLESEVKPVFYKISAPDCNYKKLIDKAVATRRTVIISETRSYPSAHFLHSNVINLYCVSAYPAKCANLMFFDSYVGLSDHTTSLIVPSLAVALGATFIEKHFKLDEMSTPDNPHSLNLEQFSAMVAYIKEAEWHLESDEATIEEEKRNLKRATRGIDGLRPSE